MSDFDFGPDGRAWALHWGESWGINDGARIDALIWPTLTYGYYPAFVEYAGSASLSAATFEAVVAEVARGILGHGCRALLVLDTGISTCVPVERALTRIDIDNALHMKIHDGPRYRRTATARERTRPPTPPVPSSSPRSR